MSRSVAIALLAFVLLALPGASQETPPAPLEAPEPTGAAVEMPAADTMPPAADTESLATTAPERTAAAPAAQLEPASAANAEPPAPEAGPAGWDRILLPMWQRLANGLPSMVKALLVLLAFWVVAMVAGAGVRKLLDLTKVDDRAVSEWGLDAMLTRADGSKRSLSAITGLAVRWVLLLLGFVAFFQSLDLNMVAQPLQGVVNELAGVVPNLLQAAIILFVYWVLAALIRAGLTKGLDLVRFNERAGRFFGAREGAEAQPSQIIGRLAFYLVLLFGLPPFLAALGQTAIVEPLTAMLGKVLSYLPNVAAALFLFFIGKAIASIVREVLTNFLAASGIDRSAERLELSQTLGGKQPSGLLGTIAYFFVIIPVVVAAVDALGIKAISTPVTATLERILAAVPLMLVATIIVLIGIALARMVAKLVEAFLVGVGFDTLPGRFGLSFLSPSADGRSLSNLVATAVMVVIVLLTAEQALATMQLTQLSDMVRELIAFLPRLATGLTVMLMAWALARFAGEWVESSLAVSPSRALAAPVARYSILFLGFSMGLAQLGVASEIVGIAVSAVFGGTALALGLAFGLGGRGRAEAWINRFEGK
jgi:hypothetical protein